MKKHFLIALVALIFPGFIQAWEAGVTIENNTKYYMTVTGKGPGNTSSPIEPGKSYSWSSTETYNTKSLLFWEKPGEGQAFMQGNCSFGPTAGVYVDRGWMADQTLCMDAKANRASVIQCANGGSTLLQWNEFEQGGTISLTFRKSEAK